jgi:hypothetical protein
MCIQSTKWNASNLWLWSLLGKSQVLNIAHPDQILRKIICTSIPVLDFLETFILHTSLVLSIRAFFRLVCGRYIPCIETHIALVLNLYDLKSLPGRYWCDGASIVSGHTSLVDCLIPRPVSVFTRVLTKYLSTTGYDPHSLSLNNSPGIESIQSWSLAQHKWRESAHFN